VWVSLVGAPNVTPFAAKAAATAARNAALGLAGVAGCALCRVLCFASAAERTNNETGLEHLRLLAATKTALKDIGGGEHRSHGVTAVLEDARGAATEALEAALGAVVTGVLVLRNGGPSFWTLTAPQLQPPLPGHLFKPATAAQTLEPNETARIPLRYAPTQAGVATVIVSVALARDGDAEWHTRARVGVMVTLRCVDPEAAARLAALAPASPFKRPRRFRDAWPSEVEDAPPAQISPGAKNGAKFWSPSKVPLALVQGHNVPGSAAFDALDAQLAAAVTHAEHAQRFKLLLLCEEAAASSDMAAYDIHAAALTPAAGGRWRVEVPGLAEGRPSVARHDTVVLRRPGDRARAYRGRVDEVRQTSLGLLLGKASPPRWRVAASGTCGSSCAARRSCCSMRRSRAWATTPRVSPPSSRRAPRNPTGVQQRRRLWRARSPHRCTWRTSTSGSRRRCAAHCTACRFWTHRSRP